MQSLIIENTGVLVLMIAVYFLALGMVSVLAPKKVAFLSRKFYRKIGLYRSSTADKEPGKWGIRLEFASGVLIAAWGVAWLALISPGFVKLPGHAEPAFSSKFTPPEAEQAAPYLKTLVSGLLYEHIGNSPMGIVAGVVTPEYSAVFGCGRKAVHEQSPPDGDTLFEIGSITKVFTATAFSALNVKGVVELDDPVREFFSADYGIGPAGGPEITLRDLATHASGLPRLPLSLFRVRDLFTLRVLYNPYERMSDEKCLAYLRKRGTHRGPDRFGYSNYGAGLLGYAMAQTGGDTYETLIKNEVCKPLGLTDTVVTLSADQLERMAAGYCGSLTWRNLCVYLPCGNWKFSEATQGAGAISSTANDLLRFLAANLGFIETGLQPGFDQAHQVHSDKGEGFEMGLGWLLSNKEGIDGPVWWHNGGTGGYRSFAAFSKKHETGVVVLGNSVKMVDDIGWLILAIAVNTNS